MLTRRNLNNGLLASAFAPYQLLGAGSGTVISSGSGAAVDAVGTEVHTAAVTSVNYTGITVGSGSHRALICLLQFDINPNGAVDPSPITAVTWDSGGTNQSMTEIGRCLNTGGVYFNALWGLVAPTSGNKTLAVSWTTSFNLFISAISFTGINQTGGATSFPNYTGAFANSTLPVTSATGDFVVGTGQTGISSTPTGTTIYQDGASGVNVNAYACYDVGAATVNVGTVSSSGYLSACSVKAG